MEKKKSGFLSGGFFSELAVVSLFFFLAAFVPFAGVVAFVFLPLPIFYYDTKNGSAKVITLFLSALAIFSFSLAAIGQLASLPIFAVLSFAGVIMAEALKRNYSIEKTVSMSVGWVFTLVVLFILYRSFLLGQTPWHLISAGIENKIRLTIGFYETLKISPEQIKLIKENVPEIVSSITLIFPATCLVSLTFVIWINLLAGKTIFRKFGVSYPDFGDLSLWKPPEKMVWFLIAGGAILLLPNEQIEILGWNVLIVTLFLYLLAGTAIVSFFLKKSGVSTFFRYLLYLLIFVQQIITCLVIAAGVIDLWTDFRKLNKPMEDKIA